MNVCSVDQHETPGRLKRGLCEKHYQRLRSYGRTSSPRDLTLEQRFWSKVKVAGPDECWEWISPEVHKFGYGDFRIYVNQKGQHNLAHRYVLELAGVDIKDKVVMHKCDNPPCVNPAHLEVGTQSDNMRDALAKGRMNMTGLLIGQQKGKRSEV